MKRTDMLVLIANQLDFLNGKFEGLKSKESFTTEELRNADVILTTMEDAGMLPPTHIGKINIGTVSAIDTVDKVVTFQTGESFGMVNTWEPDDET